MQIFRKKIQNWRIALGLQLWTGFKLQKESVNFALSMKIRNNLWIISFKIPSSVESIWFNLLELSWLNLALIFPPSWTHSTLSLTSSSLTSKNPISCSTIYGQAGTQTTATRRTGYRRTARLFNIYHLLPLDATTYRGFLCHCIIELVSSRLQNWIEFSSSFFTGSTC